MIKLEGVMRVQDVDSNAGKNKHSMRIISSLYLNGILIQGGRLTSESRQAEFSKIQSPKSAR